MRTLFAMPSRASKEEDKKTLEGKARKKSGPIVNSGGTSLSSRIALARQMSERLLGHLKEELDNYTQESQLTELIDLAIKNGYMALDTETDGLDTIDGNIAGVCLYTPGKNAAYIPCGHISHMTHLLIQDQISKDFIASEIQRAIDGGVKFIFHNAKFDMHVCYWLLGVYIKPYWDTSLAGNMLNENEPHSLKVLWNKYCSDKEETAEVAKFNTLFKGIIFNMIPLDFAYLYAANDAKMTYDLFEFQRQYLEEEQELCKAKGLTKVAKLFKDVEMPLVEAVFDMERTGIALDTEYIASLKEKYTKILQEAQAKAYEEIAKVQFKIDELSATKPALYRKLENPINLSSTTQLAILFYDVMGFVSNDKKSPRGTGEEILNGMNHPICKALVEYRGVNKLMTTYIDAIPAQVKKKTGKLHASFNQYGAKTGRFSSSDPNLQNIPSKNKDIRKMFIADPGYVLVSSDYSQQEPRCLAHMSRDESMIKAYLDNKDLYALIASELYSKPYDECLEFRPDGTKNPDGKKRRDSVKSVLLGIMYGRGSGSIAEQMGISKKEADKIIADFFKQFPRVADFVLSSQQLARDYGYVETACGRKRRLTDMQLEPYEITCVASAKSANFNPLFDDEDEEDEIDLSFVPDDIFEYYVEKMEKAWSRQAKEKIKEEALAEGYKIVDNGGKIADAERQCVNSIIQGSSADITKMAMVDIFRDEELRRLDFKLLLTVHDEVIGTCPIENAKVAGERLSQVMINAAKHVIAVPMKCDVEVTDRWYGEPMEL